MGVHLGGANATVSEIKKSINTLHPEYELDALSIIFAGKILADEKTLEDCNISEASTAFFVVRNKPTPQPPRVERTEEENGKKEKEEEKQREMVAELDDDSGVTKKHKTPAVAIAYLKAVEAGKNQGREAWQKKLDALKPNFG